MLQIISTLSVPYVSICGNRGRDGKWTESANRKSVNSKQKLTFAVLVIVMFLDDVLSE